MVLSVRVFKCWPSMHIFYTFLRTREELQLWKHLTQNWKLGVVLLQVSVNTCQSFLGSDIISECPTQEDENAVPPLKQQFSVVSLLSPSSIYLLSTHIGNWAVWCSQPYDLLPFQRVACSHSAPELVLLAPTSGLFLIARSLKQLL